MPRTGGCLDKVEEVKTSTLGCMVASHSVSLTGYGPTPQKCAVVSCEEEKRDLRRELRSRWCVPRTGRCRDKGSQDIDAGLHGGGPLCQSNRLWTYLTEMCGGKV